MTTGQRYHILQDGMKAPLAIEVWNLADWDAVREIARKRGVTQIVASPPAGGITYMPLDGITDVRAIEALISEGKSRILMDFTTNYLYHAPRDIVLGRPLVPKQLQQQEAALAQLTQQRAGYDSKIATAEKVVTELRAKVAELPVGPDYRALVKEMMEMDSVIDFRIGPCWDEMSRQLIPADVVVISFLPSLYDGYDNGWEHGARGGSKTHPEKIWWALTTPVRLYVHPNGSMTGGDTFHPHTSGGRVCTGNVTHLIATMMRENNIPGLVDTVGMYAVGHMERDYIDCSWSVAAVKWWRANVLTEQPHTWGMWDGRSVRLASPLIEGSPTVNIEEYFNAPLADILHVMSSTMDTRVKCYASTEAVRQLQESRKESPGSCRQCGSPLEGCPCHKGKCSVSLVDDLRCKNAPIEGWVPYPTRFPVGGVVYNTLTTGANTCEEAVRIAKDYDGRNVPQRYCGARATMRTDMPVPIKGCNAACTRSYFCDAHVPADVKVAMEVEASKRSELARMVGPANIDKTIRHMHNHGHLDGYQRAYTHTHHHDHTIEEVASETLITQHPGTHTAFRGATGTSVLRHRRDLGD